MKTIARRITTTALCAATLVLGACGSMTHREKSTVAGAAIGGVAGSVLSNGSGVGTVGGAAIGGVIGNEVGKRREGR